MKVHPCAVLHLRSIRTLTRPRVYTKSDECRYKAGVQGIVWHSPAKSHSVLQEMQVLLLPLAAALLLGSCSALDFKLLPTAASNDSTYVPSAGSAMGYSTEMMMMFTNMSEFFPSTTQRKN